ncbi:DUF2147 domain-containing protein [Rhizobium grahamii]|uniref:DUF2147 domain-containing protein n=2 Tax=Rhizobium grahamii TaxID=1120045 RepID=S3H6U3_9HYPH|nr:DUF2147 domain-containing protein [Rhizobium grahamii]EPE94607.1 hypothetical protein RGCCGE502_28903 [Rhizobium grahamii CCGE 502]RDJ06124.1 hypothetical protein B5K06_23355 [Rhizobium grahamii]
MKRLGLITASLTLVASSVLAQEPVVGTWKTEVGTTAAIDECAQGYCITMKTGNNAGKRIGTFRGSKGNFTGTIVEPESRKTFNGVLTQTGDTVHMRGCTMKVICVSLIWTRL